MEFKALEANEWTKALSTLGRHIDLPQGIFHWSGRAKREADINGTIGTAKGKASDIIPGADDKFITYYLPVVREKMKELGPEQIFPYAPILGTAAFREKWRRWILKKSEPYFPIDPDLLGNPMVAPGVSTALVYVMRLFLSPGETLVCPDKRWENYDLMFADCMDIPITSYPFFKHGKPAPENLEKTLVEVARKQDKLVTILNFPNNPTGYMPLMSEVQAWRDAVVNAANATGKPVVVIFDDAYDGYVFDDDAAQISIFGMFAGVHKNVIPIKTDGVSKEFLWYGGRTAAITFALHPDLKDRDALHNELENKIGGFVRGTVSNSSRQVQEAVALALDDPDRVLAEREAVRKVLADRCHKLQDSLKSISPDAAWPEPFNAGFFCLLNLANVDSETLADHLLKKYRVGTIPIKEQALGINAIRVAFCSVDVSQIDDLVAAINSGIADLG